MVVVIVTHQAEKIWTYYRATARPHDRTDTTALSSSPVVSALGPERDDPGSSPGRGKALCPWDVRGKKCELRF